MTQSALPYQVIDANLGRISEGLRVIEEYLRFLDKNKPLTTQLSTLRKKIAQKSPSNHHLLKIRNISQDMRAYDPPQKRKNLIDMLTANFKRVQQALRVMEEYTGDLDYATMRYDVYILEKEVILPLYKSPLLTGIYAISDSVTDLLEAIQLGASIIQLRDKTATKAELYQKALAIKAATPSVPFIINDHIDIALAVDADGLHTGQDDIPISAQRQILGHDKLLGKTTHTLNQGLNAQSEGADYISIGPVWKTPSKPNRDPIGFDYLASAPAHIHIPTVAIGGVNIDTIDQILPHHPTMIGLIRAYHQIPLLLNRMKS
jgi:thiamine-phosphate pyrophosphorylase